MELAVGEIREGKVTGITKFGAFVSLEGGKSGLVHISEVANTFVNDVHDHVQIGQTVKVKILSITEDGKINLSIKRALEPPREERPRQESRPRPQRSAPPVTHSGIVLPPKETSGDPDFEDRLKKFLQESDSRIADSRYAEHRSRRRGR